MTSLVDSQAHFARRANEMAMSAGGLASLTNAGLVTYGKLAFSHGQPGVAIDETAFATYANNVLGAMTSLADVSVLKRLLFESHTMVLAQLKEQVTNPDAAGTRKMPPVEREARMADLKARLPGAILEKQVEPSHCLLDACMQQWESHQLKYIGPDKCASREFEVTMSKSAKQIELDADKLLVKEKAEMPDHTAHTELQVFEALRRRGVGYAFADIISWNTHEKYLMSLFARLQKQPPQSYVKPSLQQVLRADRAVFTKLIQVCTSVRRAPDGTLPIDHLLLDTLNHPDAAYHLMPLPKPAQPAKPDKGSKPDNKLDWNNHKGGSKGKWQSWERWQPYHGGKGLKGKSKGRERFNMLPKALQGRDNVSSDPHGRRLCFGFQLGRCDRAPAGGECPNGWHLCCRRHCQAPHPEQEHDEGGPPKDPRK